MVAVLKHISNLLLAPVFLACLFAVSCQRESLYHKKIKTEVIITANDARLGASIIHFYKDTVYVLANSIFRNAGQKLIVDAGTLVKVNDNIGINIGQGATIEAKGTTSDPVIFTSSALKGGPGAIVGGANNGDHAWYGIRITGDALNQPAQSSGSLSYVRIEFAGIDENGSPSSSLYFQNVSSATLIENIQVSYSYNNSAFEFSGGNCNASNLVSYASASNDYYLNSGFTGKLQNLLAYRHPYFPAGTAGFGKPLAGVLIDGAGTFPLISNLTVAGPDGQTSSSVRYNVVQSPCASLLINNDAKFMIRNSVLFGFPLGALYMNSHYSAVSLQSDESSFTYSIAHSNDKARVFYLPSNIYPPFTSDDFRQFMLQSKYSNTVIENSSELKLADLYDYDAGPDPTPTSGSPVLNGANFDGAFQLSFFKKVSYRGAFGSDNWMKGWVNFTPLLTDYNN